MDILLNSPVHAWIVLLGSSVGQWTDRMQNRVGYLVAGALGVVTLCFAVAAGYWENRAPSHLASKAVAGAPVSDHQKTERRRARMAEVAAAGATTQ